MARVGSSNLVKKCNQSPWAPVSWGMCAPEEKTLASCHSKQRAHCFIPSLKVLGICVASCGNGNILPKIISCVFYALSCQLYILYAYAPIKEEQIFNWNDTVWNQQSALRWHSLFNMTAIIYPLPHFKHQPEFLTDKLLNTWLVIQLQSWYPDRIHSISRCVSWCELSILCWPNRAYVC